MDKIEPHLGQSSEKSFKEVNLYMERLHKHLTHDYKTVDGLAANCGEIAADIAILLTNAGEKPYLLSINASTEMVNGVKKYGEVMAKVYKEKGRSWGSHIVCVNEGVVYDPILETPLPLEEYLSTVFVGPVETYIDMTHESFKELYEEIKI